MTLEEIEKRYAKGYDYTDREHRNQLYNDMEWLIDQVENVEKLKSENEWLKEKVSKLSGETKTKQINV